ncbi:MAG: metallophosphatase family protein [Actinomycetota bacterium]|nr:metallophosphatase family protein [Actinomycetota bacterium]
MRACVVSDIHGNLHALEAVLEAIDGEGPDAIWCLGDLVGYGPQPNSCCALVRERADLCLVGNHDLAVLGQLELAEFQPDAAKSARWTTSVLEPGHREFLKSLEPSAARDGVGLYHASPRDPVWEYVLSAEAAAGSLGAADEPLVLVGHSHVALSFALEAETLRGGLAPDSTELDLASADRWLINPGSVGQPRDGDPRAAYLVLDLAARRADFHRVAYPIDRTQTEIREQGLPEALAARLEHGL